MSKPTWLEPDVGSDAAQLRRHRRELVIAAMERHELDVLVLSRSGNVRFASGLRELWRSGRQPFQPLVVVDRRTGKIRAVCIGADVAPPEMSFENLLPRSWSPAAYIEALRSAGVLAGASRIGCDAMSPGYAQLLRDAAPAAKLVNGEVAMREARATKSSAEVGYIAAALAATEDGLAAASAALHPGVTEGELQRAFLGGTIRPGTTVAAFDGTFCATPTEALGGAPVLRRVLDPGRAVRNGDLVAAHAGAMHEGYEGALARTWVCGAAHPGSRQLASRAADALEDVIDACQPGACGADILAAHAAHRLGAPPPVPIAHGIGLGFEWPVIGGPGAGVPGAGAELIVGMVLAVQVYAWAEGVGGHLLSDLVQVTASGPVRLVGTRAL